MTRWIAVIACTLALGLTVPMGIGAEAAKKPKMKTCAAAAMDGKKVSWKCQASEKCCWDWLATKGTCVAASAICL